MANPLLGTQPGKRSEREGPLTFWQIHIHHKIAVSVRH